VAADILNYQSGGADKGLSSILEVELGLTTPHDKNNLVMIYYKGPRTWTLKTLIYLLSVALPK
jgi:hypothetical protein